MFQRSLLAKGRSQSGARLSAQDYALLRRELALLLKRQVVTTSSSKNPAQVAAAAASNNDQKVSSNNNRVASTLSSPFSSERLRSRLDASSKYQARMDHLSLWHSIDTIKRLGHRLAHLDPLQLKQAEHLAELAPWSQALLEQLRSGATNSEWCQRAASSTQSSR